MRSGSMSLTGPISANNYIIFKKAVATGKLSIDGGGKVQNN